MELSWKRREYGITRSGLATNHIGVPVANPNMGRQTLLLVLRRTVMEY